MDDPELDMDVPSPSGSFLNEDASVSMEGPPVEEEEEDEDLYYIPPRRPSLDLGPSPMDSGALFYVERPKSPAESYLSLRSEGSGSLSKEDRSHTKIHLERADSFSSCYTVDSDDCEIRTKVISKEVSANGDALPELKENLSDLAKPHLTISFVFKAICNVLKQLRPVGLETFRGHLWHRYPESFSTSLQSMDIVDIVDRMLECYSLQVCLQITKTVLLQLEQKWLVGFLENIEIQNEVQYEIRERLKKTYGVFECPRGVERPLDEVYTDLHIVSYNNNGPNVEHEVLSIKKPGNKTPEEISIKDIINAEFIVKDLEQMVLLSGVAGSGKSMILRKMIWEWSNNPPNHVHLMFPLSIKELKQTFGDSDISFLDILHHFYPETKKLKEDVYDSNTFKILYVFEDLEEIIEDINFHNTPFVFKLEKPAKLKVIFASILRNHLLRCGCYVVFASRTLANFHIPFDTKHLKYEVLGFKEKAREEYFKKRFSDKSQASRVIKYVRSSRTLQTMCHLPLFCSLLGDSCQSIFNQQGPEAELQTGITLLYTRLFLALLRDHRKEGKAKADELTFIMTLGKLAFSMLEKGQYFLCINYPEQMGPLDEREAVTYIGLSTVFYVKPMPFVDEKMFSFLHPTMQEYVAALFALLAFVNEDCNSFEAPKGRRLFPLSKSKKSNVDLFKNALERSLACEDGKMDVFVRFLFGLSSSSNIELIQQFFKDPAKWSSVEEEAEALIRKKIAENQFPARAKNLELCLEELIMNKSNKRKSSIRS